MQPQEITSTLPRQQSDLSCVSCPALLAGPTAGQYRIDAGGSPTMLKSLMYKLSYYE